MAQCHYNCVASHALKFAAHGYFLELNMLCSENRLLIRNLWEWKRFLREN